MNDEITEHDAKIAFLIWEALRKEALFLSWHINSTRVIKFGTKFQTSAGNVSIQYDTYNDDYIVRIYNDKWELKRETFHVNIGLLGMTIDEELRSLRKEPFEIELAV